MIDLIIFSHKLTLKVYRYLEVVIYYLILELQHPLVEYTYNIGGIVIESFKAEYVQESGSVISV